MKKSVYRNRHKKKSSKAFRLKRYHRIHNQQYTDIECSGEFYHLKSYAYKAFLPIEAEVGSFYQGPFPSYGGAQLWWSKKSYKDSTGNSYGCGVIAATNFVLYLASHFEKYSDLVEGSYIPLSQRGYMKVADELWMDIQPYSGVEKLEYHIGRDPYTEAYPFGFGVTVSKLLKGIKAYGSRRGVGLDFMTIKAVNSSDQQGVNFVKLSLLRNYPVLLLSLNNGIDKYEYHWVLITALEEDLESKETKITISTWGALKCNIDFKELWNYGVFMENQYMISLV